MTLFLFILQHLFLNLLIQGQKTIKHLNDQFVRDREKNK